MLIVFMTYHSFDNDNTNHESNYTLEVWLRRMCLFEKVANHETIAPLFGLRKLEMSLYIKK